MTKSISNAKKRRFYFLLSLSLSLIIVNYVFNLHLRAVCFKLISIDIYW